MDDLSAEAVEAMRETQLGEVRKLQASLKEHGVDSFPSTVNQDSRLSYALTIPYGDFSEFSKLLNKLILLDLPESKE